MLVKGDIKGHRRRLCMVVIYTQSSTRLVFCRELAELIVWVLDWQKGCLECLAALGRVDEHRMELDAACLAAFGCDSRRSGLEAVV